MVTTTGVAVFIKSLPWRGDARLFKVEPPYGGHSYIVVSAALVLFSGPETYIFPADVNGEVTDWCEMDGSRKGSHSHLSVLEDIGYSIAVLPAEEKRSGEW